MNHILKHNTAGFTLVELLVVMAVGAVVMVGVMTTFITQHKSYLVQDDVVEMQQNLRVAMEMITSDIRTAGYNPSGSATNAGVFTATAGRLGFTQDLDEDGVTTGTKESVTYGFKTAEDPGLDGIRDAGPGELGQDYGGGFMMLAENIYGIEFFYTLEDGTQTLTPTAFQFGLIRSIVVSILAVSNSSDEKFTNTMTYTTGSGAVWGPFNDNLRRRMLVTAVHSRNLGL